MWGSLRERGGYLLRSERPDSLYVPLYSPLNHGIATIFFGMSAAEVMGAFHHFLENVGMYQKFGREHRGLNVVCWWSKQASILAPAWYLGGG